MTLVPGSRRHIWALWNSRRNRVFPSSSPRDLTDRINEIRKSSSHEKNEAFELVYETLREIAHRQHARWPDPSKFLNTTVLVSEAYLRLFAGAREISWESRQHFFGSAATTMRRLLVDHARRARAQKRRAPGERIPLDEILASFQERSVDLLSLNEALDALEEKDSELRRLVELRFFAGLSVRDITELLERPQRSVERDLSFIRRWIWRRIR